MVIIYIVLDMHPFGISKTVSGLSFDSPFFMSRSPTNITKGAVKKSATKPVDSLDMEVHGL